jgi:hypothetical protein
LALDLSHIERCLSLEGAERCPEQSWLRESYRDPPRFWQGLRAYVDAVSPLMTKSVPLGRYDFYHDLVVRHQRSQAAAFTWYEPNATVAELSFRQLAVAASRRAAAWQRAGLLPGQVVCILRPLGVELQVSLCAALKLGLTFSLLPPLGRRFVGRRIANLGPERIDTDEVHLPLLPAEACQLVLPAGDNGDGGGGGGHPGGSGGASGAGVSDGGLDVERSHSYPSGATVALLFDPSSPTPAVPRPLSADAAYLWPLRDGVVALGLRPGQAMAAPGMHFLDTQPAMLFAAMLAGATFCHLELDQLAREPSLLLARPLRALGVSAELRELLLEKPLAVGERWACWFRDPAAAGGRERFSAFISQLHLEGMPVLNLRYGAALGGCSLFSPRRRGQAHAEVLPSAGIPWFLASLTEDGQESVTGYGRLALASPAGDEDRVTTTPNVLARLGNTWVFAASLLAGSQGRHYPSDEVLAVLADAHLEGCQGASVCLCPGPDGEGARAEGEQVVVLILFCGAGGGVDEARLLAQARRRIEWELGAEFLPQRAHCFPLRPRQAASGEVDHRWCRDQYLSGALARKARDPFFRTLSRLREVLWPRPAERGK